MRPSRLCLQLFVGLMVIGLGIGVSSFWLPDGIVGSLRLLWWFVFAAVIVAALIDASVWREKQPIQATRTVPNSLAVGAPNKVAITIQNCTQRPLPITIIDHYPSEVTAEGFPRYLRLEESRKEDMRSSAQLSYIARPIQRGAARFGDIDFRIRSRLGLWDFRERIEQPQMVKIYPNFTAISQFETLGHDQQISQIGVHLIQRRGQGMDFQQLREYREGDTTRQIDWKASSRYRKIISREYQDERDQDIIFLLDCGRRMRTKDGELSHFDHALNSLLLLSYVALKQGDGVGLLSFAGEGRWLPPVKGKASINTLLNTVYDLHSSSSTSDLVEASTELMSRHRKRSLVVLLTNLREEDREDVVAATRLLAKQHIVMVANLRESFLDETVKTPVIDFESSLTLAETTNLLSARDRLMDSLRQQGVIVTDSTPQQLHIRLVNEYWALKRSGRL
ncbi:DUF58 domain-containing protein [Aurantivibrio plasticivorans]